MENWEQAMKAMQDEISELKDKVNQVHGLKDQLG